MIKRLLVIGIVIISIPLFSQNSNLTIEFSDAIISRYPGTINDMTGKGWEYSNSIVLHGIERAYYATGDEKYLNYIKKYVDTFVSLNGNISFNASANNLDHLHPGLLCLFLYRETGDNRYKVAANKIRNEFDNQPRNSSGGFWHKQRYPNQMWLDGIYMAEPFLVRYGQEIDDAEYCNNEATKQVLLLAEHAFDSTTKLLYHGWDETKSASWADITSGVSPVIWSRAMGWYCMALVDILRVLPHYHENYLALVDLIKEIAEGLKNSQNSINGLWYQVVDKNDKADNWPELSGTCMFIYALQTAINDGYIDESYSSVVSKAWMGIQNYISTDSKGMPVIKGYVGGMGIKDSYKSYVNMNTETCPPSKHPHGYCAILMASSVIEGLDTLNRYSFELNVKGEGTIKSSLPEGAYISGRKIKLTANPDDGYTFLNWNNDSSLTDTSFEFEITDNTIIIASFEKENKSYVGSMENYVNVFPNPVHDFLRIRLDEVPEYVEISDLKGSFKNRIKGKVQHGSYFIDFSSYYSGIYIVNIVCGLKLYSYKIVKE